MHRGKSTKTKQTKQINQNIYRSIKPVKYILHRRSVSAMIVQGLKQLNYVIWIRNRRNKKALTNYIGSCVLIRNPCEGLHTQMLWSTCLFFNTQARC